VTADYVDLGGASVATKSNLNLMMRAPGDSTNLALAAVITTGTPTFGATDLVIKLGFRQL
jgi:hypothetical protein